MIKITGLKFAQSRTYFSHYSWSWPSVRELESADRVFYGKKNNIVFLDNPESVREYVIKRAKERKDAFFNSNHDIVRLSQDDLEIVKKHIKKRVERRESSNKKRAFIKSVTKGAKLDEVLLTTAFLNGATKGGGRFRISDNNLGSNYNVLITRIGKNEFILGKTMCGLDCSQSSSEIRVMSVISRSRAVFWPSNSGTPGVKMAREFGEIGRTVINYGDEVLDWCISMLTVVQLKMPTARLNPEAYDYFHKDAVDIFKRAVCRWGGEINREKIDKIEDMISIYGDKGEMKKYNTALRMEYEMTK